MDGLPSVGMFETDLNARYDTYMVSALSSAQPAYGSFRTVPGLPFEIADIRSAGLLAQRGNLPGRLHDRFHLLICEEGQAQVDHFGHHARLDAGDCIVLDSTETCLIHVPEVNVGRTVELPRGNLLELGVDPRNLAGLRIAAGTGLARHLIGLVDMIVREPGLGHGQARALQEIMARMLAQCLPAELSPAPDQATDREVARMADWVRGRLVEGVPAIEELALHFGYSRRNLYRLFARIGATPHGWMQTLRLEEARRQLRARESRKQSITSIAYACGFADAAHFSRLFKKQFGYSPVEWSRACASPIL